MNSVTLENLSSTLVAYARPGRQPRDLLNAVRRRYPKATKPEVVRAAFYAVLELADDDIEKAQILHDFAMRERLNHH